MCAISLTSLRIPMWREVHFLLLIMIMCVPSKMLFICLLFFVSEWGASLVWLVILDLGTRRLLWSSGLRLGCLPRTPLEATAAMGWALSLCTGLLLSLPLDLSSWASQIHRELSFDLLPRGSYQAWLPVGSIKIHCEDLHLIPHFHERSLPQAGSALPWGRLPCFYPLQGINHLSCVAIW